MTFLILSLMATSPADNRPIDFARDVRPILANYCFPCHGADDQARKAKLRLDVRESAILALANGHRPIVPGKSAESEIIARLTTVDKQEAMPPAKFGKKPTQSEIETLRRWIERDAKYAKHWSFLPPVRAPLPWVSNPSWVVNPIDEFVLARLDHEKFRPSVMVERSVLLRRASIDLTGLPPTLLEADQFAKDTRPDAYERAIDAILAKPSYGERWASMWLDLARYGDSVGYTHDPPRTNWRWRDWLIQALNDNRPYDQMTIEMLAGDLLPSPTSQQTIATGFHRNTTTNTEGGSNPEEYHFAAVADRVNHSLN